MSKNTLVAILAGAVLVVAILAVLTPTVIVNGTGHQRAGISVAHMDLPGGWAPYPFPQGRGRLPDLRDCLQRHGLGRPSRSTPPTLGTMRRALRDCAPSVH